MNKEKSHRFLELLNGQTIGKSSARKQIENLDIKLADGYCLFNLYEQWKGAFSFKPGRQEAFAPITSLAGFICGIEKDDTLLLYETNEWKLLCDLRGPFECAIRKTCSDCHTSYVGFGTSGFVDDFASTCDRCGNVWVQSRYDEDPIPQCDCTGTFISNCPTCKSSHSMNKRYFSSYEYFDTHQFQRKSG